MRLLSGLLVILSDGTRAVIDLILSGTYEKDQLAGELDIIIRKLVLFRTNNFIIDDDLFFIKGLRVGSNKP